jgi:hypothetical protein
MLEAGAPVPYVQAQVGHEDATTTLKIYAQVLKRRDRKRHGQAFDALMTTNAVPSSGIDHDAKSNHPCPRLGRLRHADGSRLIWPQARAKRQSVTSSELRCR